MQHAVIQTYSMYLPDLPNLSYTTFRMIKIVQRPTKYQLYIPATYLFLLPQTFNWISCHQGG